ncbi:Ankyrin repeat domain-containing protein 7 [Microtus ochrogaster]|uniref:Ankyrin repeat domain-containing protein 7 n=1 Tax=Microtus ochrogaster TaxID=79684 RepID=A0A8J6KVQ1_MICOH|nr:Ankyrin repeat domain-containing protein 7 [Microtus ochrogaster]
MKDDEGCTPLIKAAQRDNIECISILLMNGADPHIVDDSGDAALHHAICRGNIPVVSKLLEYNVDINAKTEVRIIHNVLLAMTLRSLSTF